MNCIVTAGPTYESLDEVRRLTNFSTGKLGTELADFLSARGHQVTLLRGESATYPGTARQAVTEIFSTTSDLLERFRQHADQPPDAIFHAAAVSDYTFGRIWLRSASGDMVEVKSGKISTRAGVLLAEMLPTPKIIASLRELFPQTKIVGWKYELEGERAEVIAAGERQIVECRTDACVVNGRAYGSGFGLVTGAGKLAHLPDVTALYEALELKLSQLP